LQAPQNILDYGFERETFIDSSCDLGDNVSMVRSMTGYGRNIATSPQGNLLIEVHSVNRRSLEMTVHAPKEFLLFDIALRKRVGERVKRGQVSVRLSREFGDAVACDVSTESLREIYGYWEGVAKSLQMDGAVDLPFLAAQASMLPRQDFDASAMQEAILEGLDGAIIALIGMKEDEGLALVADLEPRLLFLESEIDKVEAGANHAPEEFRKKLSKRLAEFGLGDDDRLARETVIFAERSDVTEEVTRLRSHIAQFRSHLKKEAESVGRSLDFLIQEMIRETNTIASKTQSLKMKAGALSLKSEIDKIREQVQNIE
jgi:uncharacterized protein (TIGR00255 family)